MAQLTKPRGGEEKKTKNNFHECPFYHLIFLKGKKDFKKKNIIEIRKVYQQNKKTLSKTNKKKRELSQPQYNKKHKIKKSQTELTLHDCYEILIRN